ncbi:MAG: hypothetical protein ABI358_14730 [Ginsengibacter sp.]
MRLFLLTYSPRAASFGSFMVAASASLTFASLFTINFMMRDLYMFYLSISSRWFCNYLEIKLIHAVLS